MVPFYKDPSTTLRVVPPYLLLYYAFTGLPVSVIGGPARPVRSGTQTHFVFIIHQSRVPSNALVIILPLVVSIAPLVIVVIILVAVIILIVVSVVVTVCYILHLCDSLIDLLLRRSYGNFH